MRIKLFALMVVIGLFFFLVVALRSEYVYAAADNCNGACPVGSVCEQVGPGIWQCESDGSTPPPPPPGQSGCGASAAPSCGGYCDSGECRSTEDRPDCHCSDSDGYLPKQCSSGTQLVCGSPAMPYTWDYCDQTHGSCDALYWPSKFTGGGACASPQGNLGTCQDNCGCCSIGDTYVCTQTHPGSYFYVNVGWNGNPTDPGYCAPATRGSWSSYYQNSNCREVRIDHGGGEIEFEWRCDYTVVCETYTQSCSCVSSCTQTAPSNLSIVAGPTVGTTASVSWALGTGGAAQYFWVDEDLAEVNAGCPTTGDCEASRQLTASDTSETVTGLTPSTTYYFHIVTASSSGGSCPSETVFATANRGAWWQAWFFQGRLTSLNFYGALGTRISRMNEFCEF
jgi:hypothetical protein